MSAIVHVVFCVYYAFFSKKDIDMLFFECYNLSVKLRILCLFSPKRYKHDIEKHLTNEFFAKWDILLDC